MTERDRLIKLLEDSPSLNAMDYRGYEWSADYLLEHGVKIPVRCKDCKHYYERLSYCEHELWMDAEGWSKEVDANGFCSRGERKDND